MMYRTTVRHKTVGNCELVLVAGGDGDISGLTNNKLLDFIVGGEDEDVEIIWYPDLRQLSEDRERSEEPT